MNEIAISKFKATCLQVLERVRTTKQPIRVTRFGKPVADIVPPQEQEATKRRLGTMRGSGRILGISLVQSVTNQIGKPPEIPMPRS